MTLPAGGNLHLPFPTPLVLTFPNHGQWFFRLRNSAEGPERPNAPEVNILVVGYVF